MSRIFKTSTLELNLLKMKAHYNNVKELYPLIVSLTLFITVGIVFVKEGMGWEFILEVTTTSIPIGVLGIIYIYFEHIGWRHRLWQNIYLSHFFKLKFPPDLRGRWKGKLYRFTDNVEHDFVIEIQQSMSSTLVKTYSPKGNVSKSILDEIACDLQQEDNFYLCYLWQGTGSPLQNKKRSNNEEKKEKSETFYGYTTLRLIQYENVKKLEGEYFTGRESSGKLSVLWEQLELKNEFI